jgi:hypothetical protein
VHRRRFLRAVAGTGSIGAFGMAGAACGAGEEDVRVIPTTVPETRAGTTRYGPLSKDPDANDLLLPEGFTSKLLAVGGETVRGTTYEWHPFPDGGACFATDDGGWIYANNSEVYVEGEGGASALRFDKDGTVVDAYQILDGTTMNCAGGATPWGTWLSCEEIADGRVWECDPLGRTEAVVRPAMGVFRHEAVAADESRRVLYMSEDERDGVLYRFAPDRWGDLSRGDLAALVVEEDGTTVWEPFEGTGAEGQATRYRVPAARNFPGGEGLALHDDVLYLSVKGDTRTPVGTSGDGRVYQLALGGGELATYWKGPPLKGPDNLAVHPATGNLFACEDGGDMEVVVITPDGRAEPFVRFVGHDGSEVTGAAFDPSGTRLIVNSQRAPTERTIQDVIGAGGDMSLGRTYMITGSF